MQLDTPIQQPPPPEERDEHILIWRVGTKFHWKASVYSPSDDARKIIGYGQENTRAMAAVAAGRYLDVHWDHEGVR